MNELIYFLNRVNRDVDDVFNFFLRFFIIIIVQHCKQMSLLEMLKFLFFFVKLNPQPLDTLCKHK